MARFSENQGGAIYGADGDKRGTRPYFDVDDINAGIARVKELGGQAGDAMPVPSMGWFSTCTDVEGNDFGLWQTDPNASSRRSPGCLSLTLLSGARPRAGRPSLTLPRPDVAACR